MNDIMNDVRTALSSIEIMTYAGLLVSVGAIMLWAFSFTTLATAGYGMCLGGGWVFGTQVSRNILRGNLGIK